MKKVSRLGQWDGPRHSSRGHRSLLAGLAQLPALARLGVVLAATLVMTGLAYCWGPPFPYRVGQVWAQDIHARVRFQVEDSDETEHAKDEAIKRLPADKRSDPRYCEQLRKGVPPVLVTYHPSTEIDPRGPRV